MLTSDEKALLLSLAEEAAQADGDLATHLVLTKLATGHSWDRDALVSIADDFLRRSGLYARAAQMALVEASP